MKTKDWSKRILWFGLGAATAGCLTLIPSSYGSMRDMSATYVQQGGQTAEQKKEEKDEARRNKTGKHEYDQNPCGESGGKPEKQPKND
jgi:hypothetical protein